MIYQIPNDLIMSEYTKVSNTQTTSVLIGTKEWNKLVAVVETAQEFYNAKWIEGPDHHWDDYQTTAFIKMCAAIQALEQKECKHDGA